MKKNALRKDFFVEIRKSLGRFLSIFLIVALGVSILVGIRATQPDMYLTGDTYADNSRLMDIKIVSTFGLTKEDVKAISELDTIENIEASYSTDVLCSKGENKNVLHVMAQTEKMNLVTVVEGRLPEATNECLIDQEFSELYDYKIGDVLKFEPGSDEELTDTLKETEYTIVGIGSSALYFSYDRGTSQVGNGTVDAFVIVPPDAFEIDVYTEIYVSVKGAYEENAFEEEYESLIENAIEKIENIQDVRCEARRSELIDEIQVEIDDARSELNEKKEEAELEIADAEAEIKDAETEMAEAKEKIEDGKEQIADGKVQIADGKKQISDGKKQIEDGKKEIADAKKQMAEGKKEIEKAKSQMEDYKALISDGKKQIADGKEELAEAKEQISAGKTQIEDGKKQIADGKQELTIGKSQIEAGKEQLEAGKQELQKAREELEANKKILAEKRATCEATLVELSGQKIYVKTMLEELYGQIGFVTGDQLAAMQATIAELEGNLITIETQITMLNQTVETQIIPGEAQLAEAEVQLAAGEQELAIQEQILLANEEELLAGEQELAVQEQILLASEEELLAGEQELAMQEQILLANEEELLASEEELLAGEQELLRQEEELYAGEEELLKAEEELSANEDELLKNEKELLEQEEELYEKEAELFDAEAELLDGEKELEEGRSELEDAKQELADKIREAEEEISDAEKEIADLEYPEWYVFDRDSLPEYSGYGDNANRIKALATVFPSLFFFVAALISLTTMTRMVEEQRVQIGTLKALGYSKFAIMKKYLYYALSATLGGSAFGFVIGEKLFPYVIINAYHSTVYPHIKEIFIPYRWGIGFVATGIACLCTGIATLSSCYKELMAQPAILMRPEAPKIGKKTVIEKIPFLWKHLNFSWKSSLRNLFRYKKRFFMTLFGIGGCMGLLMVGYGLRDSISSISKYQYGELQLYDTSIFIDDQIEQEEKEKLYTYFESNEDIASYMNVNMENITAQHAKEEVDTYLTVIRDEEQLDEFFVFRDRKTKEQYELTDEGVIISEKTADMLGATVGDEILLTEDGKFPKRVVIANICENYFGHYIYMTDVLYEQVYDREMLGNSVLIIAADGIQQSDLEEIGENVLTFDDILNVQYTKNISQTLDDMIVALDRVMVVLILVAGMLSFVVLYNLNNINITERRRELATLKVLGFFPGEVGMYVYRENILLTFLGVIVGCFMGKYLHLFTVKTVEVDAAMFGRTVFLQSYLICALYTILFSIIVNWIMYFKLKKINMVESLKSVE